MDAKAPSDKLMTKLRELADKPDGWGDIRMIEPADARAILAALPSDAAQAPDTIAPAGAVNLACYLVDHCDGETITEESLQRWIGAMVKLPRYNPTVESELASMTRMFHAACADLGAINEALGLDPDDGGAEPIIGAIEELKAQIAAPVAPAVAAPFEWPRHPRFPSPTIRDANGSGYFTEHQMQGYANEYGELVRAAVRVCAISDVECSRGCGTGTCKKESAHDHIAHDRKLVAQPDERAADVGTWLWSQLMVYCAERRIAPATHGRLFQIVDEARRAFPIDERATQQATEADERAAFEDALLAHFSACSKAEDASEMSEATQRLRDLYDRACTHGSAGSSSFRELLRPVIAAKIAMGERDIQHGRFEEMFPKFLQAFDEARATTPSPVAGSAGQAPWVSVKDRLPTQAGTVLAYYRPQTSSEWRSGAVFANDEGFSLLYPGASSIQVSHWMPMPPAPGCAPTAPSLTTDAGAVLTEAQRTTINEAANIIAIFTGHDSYANLKQKFGDDPWTDVNKIAADLRALLAAHPTEQRMSDAARDVLAERVRQVSGEGWDAAHDDGHQPGTLAAAASAYALAVADDIYPYPQKSGRFHSTPPDMWPFSNKWWKPKDYRTALVKSGALILAEIERIDRAARKAEIERSGGEAC
ncbi:uncharacterized protein DUF551 [Paraburkholderia eburnea]|uniref:Uncharacterized protein DUF551 n=1 Tax=Paraburkholderia eburnea TaxID=1189126 RepID=A0A2S4MIH2_9BURK|nr:DUF551 domain-containing protein [Paraburkholderia eburnea]POR54530.1 uncharacterized protein DUF551 [Paraburkholderia eburnea]PRZ19745.1 uncharacterized protein DUF551 [Paraburkholderia eburnea]